MDQEHAFRKYLVLTDLFATRLRQRDTVALFFITASGVLLGFVRPMPGEAESALFLVPLLGSACALMMAYQSHMVEAIHAYVFDVLRPCCPSIESAFEFSDVYATEATYAVKLRCAGYVVLLLLPSIWAFLYAMGGFGWLAWLVGMFEIGSVALLVRADLRHVFNVRTRAVGREVNEARA